MYLTLSLSYVTGVVIVGRFNLYDNLEKKQRILMFFSLLVMAVESLLRQPASLKSIELFIHICLFRHFIVRELFQNHQSRNVKIQRSGDGSSGYGYPHTTSMKAKKLYP